MRRRLWVWTAPRQVERGAGTIRFKGWTQYEPERVPAMWMRIAGLGTDLDGWLGAIEQYGPLLDTFGDDAHEERHERDPWVRAIEHLWTASTMWKETAGGIWELPSAPPVELTTAWRRLRNELARVVAEDGVKLAVRGLDLVPEPGTLDAYLWLSAAESVRDRHRFKRCERCAGWFAIRRTDAQFCSAVCRNKREEV